VFATVAFDVDSTLSGIEGIDWLAARRSPEVARAVAALTSQAMDGSLAVEQVYERRLELVRPTRIDAAALVQAYVEQTAAGARDVLDELRHADVRVIAVSGGIRETCAPFCATLGFADADVHAVSVQFSPDGLYAGVDAESPLRRKLGKPDLIGVLRLPHPLLAVGDGITDLEIRTAGAAEAFAAFTGFVAREAVCAKADYLISSMQDVIPIVFPGSR
jgi:phosphoserine phosphatase